MNKNYSTYEFSVTIQRAIPEMDNQIILYYFLMILLI